MSKMSQAIIEAEENGTLVWNEETQQYEKAGDGSNGVK